MSEIQVAGIKNMTVNPHKQVLDRTATSLYLDFSFWRTWWPLEWPV